MTNETSLVTLQSRLTDRIWNCIPVTEQAFYKLLGLLEIRCSTRIPTACVTMGSRSSLLINPEFVTQHCRTDPQLSMLVMHELFHVLLGHTKLYDRITPAQNWAFDAVINAHLCLLFPESTCTSLFRNLYSPTVFPEALLRPPEGWNTPEVKWVLQGEAGSVHQALYTESSATYEELHALLRESLGDQEVGGAGGEGSRGGSSLEQLLGNHASESAETGADPDFDREVQEIVARWPIHEKDSGRDRGGTVDMHRIQTKERKPAVSAIRQALWPLLDLNSGSTGITRMKKGFSETTLPFRSVIDRRAEVLEAFEHESLFFRALTPALEPVRFEKAHIYVDVSGSMAEELPVIYGALCPLSPWLHPRIHGFSTEVHDFGFEELKQGSVRTTYGTSIDCVTDHILKHRVKRALIITDGWVGAIPGDHQIRLEKCRVRVNSVVSVFGDTGFASGLNGKVFRHNWDAKS